MTRPKNRKISKIFQEKIFAPDLGRPSSLRQEDTEGLPENRSLKSLLQNEVFCPRTVIPAQAGIHMVMVELDDAVNLTVIPAQAGIHIALNLRNWIPNKSTRE